ncbi:MAG TPA: DUF2062 domain-containing protein [Opitutaceae bacterium]|jgi:uncharacterized protein (DUF2062 family)
MPDSDQSFWRRRILSPIAHQLTQGITPQKIALTVAVGSACALFPIVGTTTILCLIAGVALRLNQPAIQIVNGICTPIHLPVIFGLYHLGNLMFGVHPLHHLGGMRYFFTEMFGLLWDHPTEFFQHFGDLVLHLIVAWAVVAPFWILLIYAIALPVMREVDLLRNQPAPPKP